MTEEEYFVLQALLDDFRGPRFFIARKEEGLFSFKKEPYKHPSFGWLDGYLKVRLEEHLFPFIDVADDKPYFIPELMAVYRDENMNQTKEPIR